RPSDLATCTVSDIRTGIFSVCRHPMHGRARKCAAFGGPGAPASRRRGRMRPWRPHPRHSGLGLAALDRLDEDLLGLGGVAPAVDLDPLALLQVLVVLEEVADALQPVAGHLVD